MTNAISYVDIPATIAANKLTVVKQLTEKPVTTSAVTAPVVTAATLVVGRIIHSTHRIFILLVYLRKPHTILYVLSPFFVQEKQPLKK